MAPDPLIVNRDQLAQFLGCSLPTVTALVRRYTDLPVIERGGLGKEWQFDAHAVAAFIQDRRDEEAAQRAERSELLAQFTLNIGREDPSKRPISLEDEIKAAKLRQLQRDELKENGFLVPTHEVRIALERAFRRFGIALDSSLDRVIRKHNLPEAVKRALEQEFADARTAFVRDAHTYLADGQDDDGELALGA